MNVVEIANFSHPRVFSAPAESLPWNTLTALIMLLEEFDDMCVRFDTVGCDGQPDRWTEGRIFHDNIALWMHGHADARAMKTNILRTDRKNIKVIK